VRFDQLEIPSPKRRRVESSWSGFFPYYAGYSESFARALIRSASLPGTAVVLDPWNGTGTTTYAAAEAGIAGIGLDLNPVMVVVAKARLLSPAAVDGLVPLTSKIIKLTTSRDSPLEAEDPLLQWFVEHPAHAIRKLQQAITRLFLSDNSSVGEVTIWDKLSSLAATFYLALFSVCRKLTLQFRSSNPTWIKVPRQLEQRVWTSASQINQSFEIAIADIVSTLRQCARSSRLRGPHRTRVTIRCEDSANAAFRPNSADLVLTSPPYCTRIDYVTATRIELAVLQPLYALGLQDLRRRMLGTTVVPNHHIDPCPDWGPACIAFLKRLKAHSSKASSTYYYRTHLDYFDKIFRSLRRLSHAIKENGAAILVVQDSFYKDVHNDLPNIVREMVEFHGLNLVHRKNFTIRRTMAGVNPRARTYREHFSAIESVLCFAKGKRATMSTHRRGGTIIGLA
jgi:hypothetical protein